MPAARLLVFACFAVPSFAVAAPAVLEIKVSPATSDPVWNAFDDDEKTKYCFKPKERWETLQLGLSAMTPVDEVELTGVTGILGVEVSSRTATAPGKKPDANGT